MVQGRQNLDGTYLKPVDVETLGFPDTALPFLANSNEAATAYNLIIECINALRLCGSVTVPTPEGQSNIDGTYPKPLSRVQQDFPDNPLAYFPNHMQQARHWNFFVDAVNALRRCYIGAAGPTQQGTRIDGGTYRPHRTIAQTGFPDVPITEYFDNSTKGATLYNYLIDALNLLRNCCGSCDAIDSGTATDGSLDLTDAIKGDNFSAWTAEPDQYSDFLTDTETNPNYADSIVPSQVNNPAPGAFWEQNFDWDTDAFVVNRNRVGQLNIEGGHRTIKAIKQAEDGERYQFGFEIEQNGMVSGYVFESLWAKTRHKFSQNFAVYDEDDPNGRGILLLDCTGTATDLGGSPVKTFNAGVYNYGYFPLFDPEGYGATEDILLANMSYSFFGGGSGSFQAELGTMRELLFTGAERELTVYAGATYDEDGVAIAGEFRMAVWIGNVGSVPTKLFDHTLTGLAYPFRTGKITSFRATDPWVLKESQGSVMCYECGGWGLWNGNGFEVDGVWDPFGYDGIVAPARVLTTIAIEPDPFTIGETETQAMTAQGYDQLGDPIATGTLAWASSDTLTATVDSSGVVTGVLAGSCTITATAGLITSNAAACTITAAGGGVEEPIANPFTDPAYGFLGAYEARDIDAADNASISQIPGRWGTTDSEVQATAGKRPVLKLTGTDGLKALRFDDVNDCIKLSVSLLDTDPYTIYHVYAGLGNTSDHNHETICAADITYQGGWAEQWRLLWIDTIGGVYQANAYPGAGNEINVIEYVVNTVRVHCMRGDVPVNGLNYYIDDVLKGSSSSASFPGQLMLGNDRGNPGWCDWIGTWVFNELHDATQRTAVFDYINSTDGPLG